MPENPEKIAISVRYLQYLHRCQLPGTFRTQKTSSLVNAGAETLSRVLSLIGGVHRFATHNSQRGDFKKPAKSRGGWLRLLWYSLFKAASFPLIDTRTRIPQVLCSSLDECLRDRKGFARPLPRSGAACPRIRHSGFGCKSLKIVANRSRL